MEVQIFGAAQEVTGSCYWLRVGDKRVLIDCGLVQGSQEHEKVNSNPFPFDIHKIDAVIITHAHIDHSGRVPLLVKRGYQGPFYTHKETVDLCAVMLEDAAYLNEKDTEWENKKRERKGLSLVAPLYTREDAREAVANFQGLEYGHLSEILPGVNVTLHDAGHILGSAIVELNVTDDSRSRRLIFSGDLGHRDAPILRDPVNFDYADLVFMESTYGDRNHRSWDDTWKEVGEVLSTANYHQGNILIPAFTVGRTQELLYVFKQHFAEWGLSHWQIFLDSPMAIKATRIYAKHSKVYDKHAMAIESDSGSLFNLPNLHMLENSDQSMGLNTVHSGAIIIAGSGMCTGGRIKHHLKHNIWRKHAHVMIVGFQVQGTPGRALVDGAKHIRLWGEGIRVNAKVHTIGGLSAHADQQGLVDWYAHFRNKPPVVLVHGEPDAMRVLQQRLSDEFAADVTMPKLGQTIKL